MTGEAVLDHFSAALLGTGVFLFLASKPEISVAAFVLVREQCLHHDWWHSLKEMELIHCSA
jgi:hypothetical protein